MGPQEAVGLWISNNDLFLTEYGPIEDTSMITDMSDMFLMPQRSMTDISKWNVSSVANMQAMFFWEQQRSMAIFPGTSLPSST
jgi:hypothetical protein